MSKLEELVQQVRSEVGADFVSTDVVGMDGLSIAGASADPNFDGSAASARFAMVMKLSQQVAKKIQMGGVDDNLVTTDQVYVITRFLGDGSYYWGLAVTREAVLGMVRMVMDEYADQIWRAIPR
jgi:predicted regulator of Ras-like GTPase activity (Roadblock/LC7/MglB family)